MIGAGVIGLELGSVWRRLGAAVTVVEFLPRITPGVDEETAKTFQRSLAKQGIVFKLGAKVTGAKASAKQVELTVEPVAGGARRELNADYVLVAIGRRPYTEGLGLESVGDHAGRARFHRHRPLHAPAPRASGRSATSPTARCWPTRPRTRRSPASSTSPARPAT